MIEIFANFVKNNFCFAFFQLSKRTKKIDYNNDKNKLNF